MPKLLLDANLSPITAKFLRYLGFDATSVIEEKLHHLPDEKIVEKAKNEKRIIVTFDQDFADIWYFKEKGKVGIVRIRTRNQTPENVNKTLKRFLENPKLPKNISGKLVVIKEAGFKVVS